MRLSALSDVEKVVEPFGFGNFFLLRERVALMLPNQKACDERNKRKSYYD